MCSSGFYNNNDNLINKFGTIIFKISISQYNIKLKEKKVTSKLSINLKISITILKQIVI